MRQPAATPKQVAAIDAMRIKGIKYKDIAKTLGIGHGTAYRAHNRIGAYDTRDRVMHDFSTARAYRCSIPFSVVPKVDELIAGGHEYGDIAAALSCGWQTIRNVDRRIGAYKKAPEKLTYKTEKVYIESE